MFHGTAGDRERKDTMNRWTMEQQQAISLRGTNLLVSAAAGSGKTAVLIERVVQLVLEDHIDIDRLLVVTFTRAAAAEMRERTASSLMSRLDESQGQDSFIRRQLSLLNQSAMMTFHAFCIHIIRNHYYLIDVEPSFRTGNQTETALLQQEALDQVMEEAYREEDPDFLRLVEMYCQNRSDSELENMVTNLYEFSCSHPNPHHWLQEQIDAFEGEADQLASSSWLKSLLHQADLRLEYAAALMQQAMTAATRPDGPAAYVSLINKELKDIILLAELAHEGNADMLDKMRHFSFERLPASRNVDPELRESARNLRNQAKKEVKRMQDQWFFRSLADFADDHRQLSPAIKQLVKLVKRYESAYHKKKKERNVLDFNDLEHRALDILRHQEARDFYQKHYEAIFIDEYQDSNRVQETLVNQIARPDNLFMVGDVKQSIYRFRLAEPELFMEKYQQYRTPQNDLHSCINLNLNFRSHPVILESVNTVFRRIMSETLGEIDYNETAALRVGKPDEWDGNDESVCVHLLEKKGRQVSQNNTNDSGDEEASALLEEWTDQEAEARLLAHQIKKMMQSDLIDPNTKVRRSVRYQDITILLRAPGNQAPQFLDILSQEDIPVYADVGTGFYESLEIELFINVLRLIDNRLQDLPLLSVLRSPFGHFSTEELTDIRLNSTEITYSKAFIRACEDPGELGKKARLFFKKLNHWRNHMKKLSLTDFMWWLLLDSGFYALCSAMPGGRQRQANIRILMKRAAEFNAVNDGGLFQFLIYIDRIKFSKSSDNGPARTLSESDDVVRLMSIHKSKGLEFPIVILAGLGKQFNRSDLQIPLLMHRSLGLGPLFAGPHLRIKRHTLARIAIREKSRMEALSEEMRVLYVAMTRAKQKLIMTGTVSDLPAKIKQWNELMNPGKLIQASQVLDWLGPVWVRLPEAEGLRNMGEVSLRTEDLIEDQAHWEFHLWNRASLIQQEKETCDQSEELRERLKHSDKLKNQSLISFFDKRFHWQYPYQQETEKPGKISVSELSQHNVASSISERSALPKMLSKPSFLNNSGHLTAAEKGTALHYFLQYAELERITSTEEIYQQLSEMVQKEMISQQEADAVNPETVWQFYDSSVGRRLRSSQKIYRELPFVVKKADEQAVLVQGVIDCCFMENGGWVLIDYKTDAVSPEALPQWMERHRPQLEQYSQALEMLTGINVKEILLYSLYLNRTVSVPVNQDKNFK
jgi:ATP-dependent helicase/nuclease subunit A